MVRTAVHLLGRKEAGWKDICFPPGQMKQNSQAFVVLPFGYREEKANLLLGRSLLGPQISHKKFTGLFLVRPFVSVS